LAPHRPKLRRSRTGNAQIQAEVDAATQRVSRRQELAAIEQKIAAARESVKKDAD